jgi:hypothetical protein
MIAKVDQQLHSARCTNTKELYPPLYKRKKNIPNLPINLTSLLSGGLELNQDSLRPYPISAQRKLMPKLNASVIDASS